MTQSEKIYFVLGKGANSKKFRFFREKKTHLLRKERDELPSVGRSLSLKLNLLISVALAYRPFTLK